MAILYATAIISLSQPAIKFETESYEFGDIKEGPAACYEFVFTNTGTEPLVISNAAPSCGCTTPTWSREPIAPGAKGTIKACYNTAGRPGNFYKSITITSNADVPSKAIYIKGNVSNTQAKKYSEEEIRLSPKIVLEKSAHNFGKVEKNQKLSLKLNVKNMGRTDLKVTSVNASCNCVTYTTAKDYIAPGEAGVVELTYRPGSMNEQQDVVNISSNDITNPSQKFTLQVNVVESIAPQSILKEQKSNFVPFK
ncbi:MAG: DUF1573 domain-containing protein [Cytophagales bacterium]|nr:DUF1573 domain-containing protein [Cytophagales bacterium]